MTVKKLLLFIFACISFSAIAGTAIAGKLTLYPCPDCSKNQIWYVVIDDTPSRILPEEGLEIYFKDGIHVFKLLNQDHEVLGRQVFDMSKISVGSWGMRRKFYNKILPYS